ncbi:MAG: nucleotide exchange factor GrpE [Candidatus Binatia bacterium]
MAKKKLADKIIALASPAGRDSEAVPEEGAGAHSGVSGAPRKKAPRAGSSAANQAPAPRRKRPSPAGSTAVSARTVPDVAAVRVADKFDVILGELRDVKQMMERHAAPASAAHAGLDASVDSLRRLLSELLEQRMESVVRDLVGIRREAANMAERDGARIVAQLDRLLESLGAVRFDAEPMDVVDPLIHVVVDERHQADAPDGVILETLRPGYRTAKGMVVSKAAVAVNRRV